MPQRRTTQFPATCGTDLLGSSTFIPQSVGRKPNCGQLLRLELQELVTINPSLNVSDRRQPHLHRRVVDWIVRRWQPAEHSKGTFAGAIFDSGGGCAYSIAPMAHVPLWNIQSLDDDTVSYFTSIDAAKALTQAGAKIIHHQYPATCPCPRPRRRRRPSGMRQRGPTRIPCSRRSPPKPPGCPARLPSDPTVRRSSSFPTRSICARCSRNRSRG